MQRTVHAPLQFYEKVGRVMNSDQERPYECNAPGCSQRFPTEDHLMIHRHKHEMTLKFPSIKNDNMLSDQTPTPTRFLKNCEEVGLFSELDCSIEQEFCKAQEEEDSKQAISLHGQSGQHQQSHSRMGNHDTSIVIQQALPSPQSSSVITQAPSTNRQIGPVPGSLSSLLHLRNRQRQPLPASMPGTLPDPTMPGSSAVLMPMEGQMSMGSNMMGMQGPAHNNSCSSAHIPSMHSEAKLRLKAALSHHPGPIANGNMNSMGHMMEMMSSRQEQNTHHHMQSHPHQHLQAPPHAYQHHGHHHHSQGHGQGGHHHQQGHNPHHNSHNPHLHPGHPHQTSPHNPMHSASHMSPATQQMHPSQTMHSPPQSGGRRRRVVDEDPDERRRKFLERNRAAATRCRQKRKVWVVSLEKKAEELTQTNMQLQNEVTMLKNEVTQLKQLLLTHKDCPITTMQKDSQGYLTPPPCTEAAETPREKDVTSGTLASKLSWMPQNLSDHRTVPQLSRA
ncbi:cyclic AMP-responsive element-binding protein 5 isoform X2 [Trematomus bernacchii]|uniref:cyclic AMP-responsive element-binding protein 5 isoform X2 n=1 Tax=Trematomus bernacchii TaxID=40690 RepID=UPI00146A6876|nr:cyclic AMP-responsive element-binding protein 5 isoform X2 [Trematomus bernacchii]